MEREKLSESEERRGGGGGGGADYFCLFVIVVVYSSMIEMSTYQQQSANYHRHITNFQVTEVNPGAPELLAQLFWTGASLLESDYQGEYTMALRLLSKVPLGVWLGVGLACWRLITRGSTPWH